MAFLVLALGCLMALAGAYEIYVGNSIISIERGWSAFISGSVLLTGGLVTVALGLVVHTLSDLKHHLLEGSSARRDTGRDEAFAAHAQPAAEIVLPMTGAVAFRPEHEADRDHDSRDNLPMHDAEASPAGFVKDEHRTRFSEASQTYPVREILAPENHDGHGDEIVLHEAAIPELRPSLDGELTPSPAMDDWLERSFADLDRDSARDAARAAATRTHPTSDDLAHADLVKLERSEAWSNHADLRSEHEEKAATPETAALPDTTHLPAPEAEAFSTSPVVGRYESEGTSYVMYADGSIEAQSAAGVYRFASMAELKAFIET